MNKVWSTAIVTAVINFGLLLLMFSPIGTAAIIFLLAAEVILGIVFCINKEKRQLGQGLLLGFGLFLLIGGVVCSIMLSNMSFH